MTKQTLTLPQVKYYFNNLDGNYNAEIYLEGKIVDAINEDGTVSVGEQDYPSPYLKNLQTIPVSDETVFEYEPIDWEQEAHDELRDEHYMD